MFTFRTLFWKIFIATFVSTTCVLLAGYGFLRVEFREQFDQMRQSESFQQLTDYVISRYEAGFEAGFDTTDQRPLSREQRRRFPPVRIKNTATQEYIIGGVRSDEIGGARWVGWDFISDSGAPYRVQVDVSEMAQANAPDLDIHQYVIGVGIIALFSWVLTFMITRPIKRLQSHVIELGGGHLNVEMESSILARRDEIGDLAVEIDQMSSRIRGLIDSKQRLLYDVSHELRAPLARLRAANEIARLRVEKAGDSTDILDRFDREIESLSQLITELMDYVKNDKSALPIETISVADLVAKIVEDQSFANGEQRLDLQSRVADSPFVMRPALLERALKNILENALKYSPEDSQVFIELAEDADHYRIKVRDCGDGIPEDQLDKVTQPFTRLHGENIEGVGLGLSIAIRAMDDLGGELHLSNAPMGGLLAELEFPKQQATN